jgi:hypothetical protein
MFPKPLRRDIVVLLCVKAVALTLIYFAFFSSGSRLEPNDHAMAAHLLHASGN